MAQQIFSQWAPVAKAQNEQGQEVYIPAAIIHAQTRDGKDELIVGAGNMVWTGSMWVPVSTQNRLPVEATLSGRTVEIGAKQFFVVNGERIVGKAADRPSASDAAAALFDGVFYHAHDTGDVWQASDGVWRHLGVA